MQKALEQYNGKNISIRSHRTSFFVAKVSNEVLEFVCRENLKQSIHAFIGDVVDANDLPSARGTQRIVSVNYLFGRPLIPYNFLKGIFTSNFRDMGNLRPSAFGLTQMSFRVPKKGQLRFSERK